MLDQLSDEKLMSSYIDENDIYNQRAFETLYNRHKGSFYRFITQSINNNHDANEIFQELWLKIIKNKNNYNPDLRFTTWAYTIARRLIIDLYRKNGRNIEFTEETISDFKAPTLKQPENEFEFKQMTQHLKIAIESLPITQRLTFILKNDAGLNIQEIAQITEQPTEKTKSQYRYAVQKLRKALEQVK